MAEKKKRNRFSSLESSQQPGKKEKKTLIGALLELPDSKASQLSQIELLSNREALVDGCKGVAEYTEDYIRLNLGNMMVRFCGRSLQLRSVSEYGVIIEGFIQSIEFLT